MKNVTPPFLQGIAVHALAFADDLLIMSTSFPGLQEALN